MKLTERKDKLHFVRTTGNDAADGRTQATAWKTIDKAVQAAPSGAVGQVGPGHFATASAKAGWTKPARSTPLTPVAQYPAVDQGRQVANLGLHSVIEPPGLSSPTGATDGLHPGVLASGFVGDVQLANPAGGDLRLRSGSPLYDAGVPVPNISDRLGVDFQGAAPDLGYELR